MLKVESLVCGKIIPGQVTVKSISPVDGNEICNIGILSRDELDSVFIQMKQLDPIIEKENFSELIKLAEFIKNNSEEFIEIIMKDSGFIRKDAEDLVNGSIEFCEDYSLHIMELSTLDRTTSFSFKEDSNINIKYTSLPYGIIAATTPRNTPLITELTIIVHALWSGNSVILRPSPGVGGTIGILIKGLLKSFDEKTLEKLSIVFADPKDFVDASLEYANILHYVGSSKYLEGTLIEGIHKGTRVLVDGDGCSMVVVDLTSDLDKAVKACYEGLIRCNGQICITIRVILINKKIYQEFVEKLIDLVNKTVVKPPNQHNNADMGPLFSSSQVESILNVSNRYKLLSRKNDEFKKGSNYFMPTVVGLNDEDGAFLTESVFGPIVGVAPYINDGWKKWIAENPINLTDVVFSNDEKFIKDFILTSKSPRKVVNLDPTVESVFEPWGAFLPSGWNDVSFWYTKYRNYFQIVK